MFTDSPSWCSPHQNWWRRLCVGSNWHPCHPSWRRSWSCTWTPNSRTRPGECLIILSITAPPYPPWMRPERCWTPRQCNDWGADFRHESSNPMIDFVSSRRNQPAYQTRPSRTIMISPPHHTWVCTNFNYSRILFSRLLLSLKHTTSYNLTPTFLPNFSNFSTITTLSWPCLRFRSCMYSENRNANVDNDVSGRGVRRLRSRF